MLVRWWPGEPAVFWSWYHNKWLLAGEDMSPELPIDVFYTSNTGRTGAGHVPDVSWLVPMRTFTWANPVTASCGFRRPWILVERGRPVKPVITRVEIGQKYVEIHASVSWPHQPDRNNSHVINLDWAGTTYPLVAPDHINFDVDLNRLTYGLRALCRRIAAASIVEALNITITEPEEPAWEALGVRKFQGKGIDCLAFERWWLPIMSVTPDQLADPAFCRANATRRVWWIDEHRFGLEQYVYSLEDPSWCRPVQDNEWQQIESADWWPKPAAKVTRVIRR